MIRIRGLGISFTVVALCVARASMYLRDNGVPTITVNGIVGGLLGTAIIAVFVAVLVVMYRRGARLWQLLLVPTALWAFGALVTAALQSESAAIAVLAGLAAGAVALLLGWPVVRADRE